MAAVVEAQGLVKRFGKTTALNGVDLLVEHGQTVAVLGPNGAGKSTFVRTVATLVRPDRGTLRVAGHDALRHPQRVRAAIGLAGQYAAVEPALTGRENLVMVGRLYGLSSREARNRATSVIDGLSLDEVADRLVRTYSGGQRRRLDLGASLVGAPRVLLLDEPTTGLDPRSRLELWDAIRGLASSGTDVVLTTQYLEEADQLASRIVIIDRGRVIADGSPLELKRRAGREVIEVHVAIAEEMPASVQALRRLSGIDPVVDLGARRVTVAAPHGSSDLAAAARALEDSGIATAELQLRRPTLDEVFLALTGFTATDLADGDPSNRRTA